MINVLSSEFTDESNQLIALLREKMKIEGIKVEKAEQIDRNDAAIRRINDSDVIIVIETVSKSNIDNVDSEMKYLYDRKIPVFAGVVILTEIY